MNTLSLFPAFPQGAPTQFCRATLVVCPVVALIQWRQEIARFTAPGSVKVVVYHGAKRGQLVGAGAGVRAAAAKAGRGAAAAMTGLEALTEADVVLTTYSVIENEFRR